MKENKTDTSKVLYLFFTAFALICIVASFFTANISTLFPGFIKILSSSQVLTVDAIAVGGLNGALLNTGLLCLMSIAILKFTGVKANGTTFGAFFLVAGFSFFGKNCLNVIPIYLGVWLYSIVKKESFTKYAHFALFGGALAPFVSEMMFPRFYDVSLAVSILSALALGIIIGFIIPPFSAHTATMHKGHNLFNVGLSAGIIGVILFALYKVFVLKPLGVDADYALNSIFSESNPIFWGIFFAVIMIASIIAGCILNGGFKGYEKLIKRTGHGCDFTSLDGAGLSFINFGITGLIFIVYFWLTKAPITGPTVGAYLCLLCWTANGSHPLNTLPIALGYVLVALATPLTLSAQGLAVGICFATGMSPLSGRWGAHWGVIAGALHISLVGYTAAFHGGFNLYNGGFTSGIVAMLLISILEALVKERKINKEQAI